MVTGRYIMMSLLIKPPNTSLELIGNNHDVKSHFAYIYFTGFNGILEKKLVDYYHPGSLTIIRNRAGGCFFEQNGWNSLHSGVIIFGRSFDIKLNESSQVLIVSKEFFHGFCKVKIHPGIIANPYESLMVELFELIRIDDDSRNEIIAIANLAAMVAKKKVAECDLIKIIKDNHLDSNFDLDRLCGLVHMSRRTVQYQLSKSGKSFSHELKKLRVMKLKEFIESSSGKLKISSLAYRSGFKNPSAANRDFLILVGISIKEYISNIREMNHDKTRG